MKTQSPMRIFLLTLLLVPGGESMTWAAAIAVTRGPYLQQGTPNSVVVRWRTDVASDSLIRYGTNAGVFLATNSHPAVTNEHVLTVAGLKPDTKYFYEIGASAGWFSGDTNDYFTTSPPVGSNKSTRLWVI